MTRKHEPLDLTPEEKKECLKEYLDLWRNSRGSAIAEMKLRSSLRRIGMDNDEISFLVRTNPTRGSEWE